MKEECEAIARHVKVLSVQPGHVFAKEGQRNSEFLMLYQGTMKRTRHDAGGSSGGNAQVLKPGGYAGGVSMLRPDGTSEHLVADSASLVLVASSDDFFSLLELLPALRAELEIKAYQRQSPLSSLFAYAKSRESFTAHQQEEFAAESSQFYTETDVFVAVAKGGASGEALKAQADAIISMCVRHAQAPRAARVP